MKVPKTYLNKYVEVHWRDPIFRKISGDDKPKGLAALARWIERGILDDLTNDVLRILHSSGGLSEEPDEWMYTWVPAALVDKIIVYEPQQEQKGEVDGPST